MTLCKFFSRWIMAPISASTTLITSTVVYGELAYYWPSFPFIWCKDLSLCLRLMCSWWDDV
jgi:hypothetical protein